MSNNERTVVGVVVPANGQPGEHDWSIAYAATCRWRREQAAKNGGKR